MKKRFVFILITIAIIAIFCTGFTQINKAKTWFKKAVTFFDEVTVSGSKMTITTASDLSAPALKLQQLDTDQPFMDFVGTSASGYDAGSFSTRDGDGAVVGPKAKSSQDGWTFHKMAMIQLNGDQSGYGLAVFKKDPVE